MPTMTHTIVGSIVPPRCLACLLLGLCLLPVAVPAAEGSGTPGAAFGTGEPRERIGHRLTDAERRRAEEQAARTRVVSRGAFGAESLETPLSGATWREEWEQRQREKKEIEDNEPNPNVAEAAIKLLFVVVLGYINFLYFMFGLPVRGYFCHIRGCYVGLKHMRFRWVEEDGGVPREEEGAAIPKKILEEYPEEIRDDLVIVYRYMPFWLKLGKLLVRKWRAWEQDDTTASSWAAESEKFTAGLLADMAALDPKKKLKGASGKSGMPSGGKAAPGKTGGHGPACAAAVSRAEQYEDRQRRRRGDKTG